MNSIVSFYKAKEDRREDHKQAQATQDRGDPLEETAEERQLRQDTYQALEKLPACFSPPSSVMPDPLPKPVLIPQRRHGDRLRGFQLLFPPQLEQSAISEQDFTIFLNRLNTAIGFDSKIKLFNFAIDVGTIAAPSWELAVAVLGTQALTTTSAYVKSRAKSQAYLDHANQRLFNPRGLQAQLVPVSQLNHSIFPPSAGTPISESRNQFQFTLGSPLVLDPEHPKAKGSLFNLNKTPIDYDPFDYGPSFPKIHPDQYCQLRPSTFREIPTTLIDKAADKVENYNVWQDRLPAKKWARKDKKRQAKLEGIRTEHGEQGVQAFLQEQEVKAEQAQSVNKSSWRRIANRHKVILVITNLDDEERAQVQQQATTLAVSPDQNS